MNDLTTESLTRTDFGRKVTFVRNRWNEVEVLVDGSLEVTYDVEDFIARTTGIKIDGVPGLTKPMSVSLWAVSAAQDWLRTL